jgi:hypothetical protein
VDADIFHRVRLHEKCAIEMRETVKSVKFRENRGRARVNSRDFRRLRFKITHSFFVGERAFSSPKICRKTATR